MTKSVLICWVFLFFLILCASNSAVKPELEPLSWRFWRKRRYIVVLMAFFGFFNVYSLRVNLSVGIVAMTENRTIHYENGTVGYVRFPIRIIYKLKLYENKIFTHLSDISN